MRLVSLLFFDLLVSFVNNLLLSDGSPAGADAIHHPHIFIALVIEGTSDDGALCRLEVVDKFLQESMLVHG